MSRKSREPLTQNETPQEVLMPPTPAAEKRDYRFKFRGQFLTPFLTLKGVAGGEAEARAELHRWLDSAIVSIDSTGASSDRKGLESVGDGKAKFTDGSALLLPEGLNVEQDRDVWNVSLAGKLFTWRNGFSWQRISSEIEQFNCAVERAKRAEKPKLFAAGAR